MGWMRRLHARRSPSADRDFDEERRFHIDARIDE